MLNTPHFSDGIRLSRIFVLAMILMAILPCKQAIAQLHQLTFTTAEGLPSNTCYGVCQDHQGRIWIGTENGLSYLEDGEFRKNPKWGILPLQVVRVFALKDSGVLVVGNNPCGVYEVQRSGTFRPWASPENLGMFYRAEMAFDQQALYLFQERSILRITPTRYDTVKAQKNPGPVLSTITAFNEPIRYVYQNDTMTFGKNGLSKVEHRARPHRGNEVWYHGNIHGLYRLHDGRLDNVSRMLNMQAIQFTYVFHDQQQNTWLSTLGEGLRVIPKDGLISQLPEIQKTSDPFVYGLFPLNKSKMIIATREDIFSVSDDLSLTKFPRTQSQMEIHPASIRDMIQINGQNIIGTYEMHETDFVLNESNLGPCVWGSQFLRRPDNRLIVAGWGSVAIYIDSLFNRKHKRADTYFFRRDLNFGRCTGLAHSDSGIYLASLTGLYWFNDRTMNFGKFTLKSGEETSFMGVVRTPGGEHYAASKRKLYHLDDDGTWRAVHIELDDLNQNITSIAVGENEHIWVGTENGLLVLSSSGIVVLDKENGLPGNMINTLKYNSSSNKMWAGTNEGVAIVNADLPFERFSYHVEIDSVILATGDGYNTLQGLTLNHDENTITLALHLKDYFGYSQPRYRYKDPLSNKWFQLDGSEIELAMLPGGNYSLEIQARISGMLWSAPSMYKFTVLAPFWMRRSFQVSVILLAFFLGWLLYYMKQRRSRKALMLKEQMNQLELESVYASLNPHFIFNTINSIQHYLLPSNNIRAINYVANFAKLIRQNMNSANRHTIPLAEELERIKLYVELEKERLNDRLHFEVKISEDQTLLNIPIPSMILQPLVENAIWHGVSPLEGGKIELEVSKSNDDIHISVTDNGIGFTGEDHENKEERFVHGLDLIRKRIKLNHPENMLNVCEVFSANGDARGVRAEIYLKGKFKEAK